MRVDWPTLLSDLAYLLGEPDPANDAVRIPCGERRLAEEIKVARGTLRGWTDGSEPKHLDGERLIDLWCRLSGKPRLFVPIDRSVLSASKVR